eukprot:359937-Chlamydomonas_euryale.AAC.19
MYVAHARQAGRILNTVHAVHADGVCAEAGAGAVAATPMGCVCSRPLNVHLYPACVVEVRFTP